RRRRAAEASGAPRIERIVVSMMSTWRAFRRGKHIPLFTICAMATAACGGASLVRDDVHRASWYELRSSHIKLTTDLPRDRAVEHSRGLEQEWRALTAMYVLIAPWAKPPDEQFPVIHLSDCSAFAEIAPEHASGFVFSSREFAGELIAVT